MQQKCARAQIHVQHKDKGGVVVRSIEIQNLQFSHDKIYWQYLPMINEELNAFHCSRLLQTNCKNRKKNHSTLTCLPLLTNFQSLYFTLSNKFIHGMFQFKFGLCEHDVLCSVILTPCHLFCQLFVTLCSPLPSLTRSPAEAACFYGLSTYFGRVGREAPPTVGLLFTSHPGMLMHFEFSSQILRQLMGSFCFDCQCTCLLLN